MPQGQVCGHCHQPNHNVRTCEAYEKYLALEAELEATKRELDDAHLAKIEDASIIKVQAAHISQLQAAVKRLTDERDRLKAIVGAFAFPSIGTGKGTAKHLGH